MPANLTLKYQKAEREYRRARSAADRLACLRDMLALIPKHKGTEKLQAEIKTRIRETKAELEAERAAPRRGRRFQFPRQGVGTIVVLGGPNAGKSRLVSELTAARTVVQPYPFSTLEPQPAMMTFEDVAIQLIDTPPVTEGHWEPGLLDLVRTADGVLLCFDGSGDDAPEHTDDVLRCFAERKTRLSDRAGFDESDLGVLHVRTRLLVTRGDDPDCNERLELFGEFDPPELPMTIVDFDGPAPLDELHRHVFDLLGLVRVYTKRPGRPVELRDPFTIPVNGTVADVAERVHQDLADSLQFAHVWRRDTEEPETVGPEHPLQDGDVVELHT